MNNHQNMIWKLHQLRMQIVHGYHATDKSKRDKKHYDKKLSDIDQQIKEIKALMLISGE